VKVLEQNLRDAAPR
jgi:hypothetical protein